MTQLHCMSVADAFKESGRYDLMGEFIDTLVNDTALPEKLRRQVWTLVSTSNLAPEANNVQEEAIAAVVAGFQDSTDEVDLKEKWEHVVAILWPTLVNCPLKKEIDKL